MAENHSPQIINRKAGFEYRISDRFTAGIQLNGSEVKSLRAGNANLSEAYCYIEQEQVYIRNLHISEWKNASFFGHDPLRIRKLLLTRTEIRKIEKELKEQGTTLVPLKIFFSETGYAKIEIGIARGKKQFDKREDIKKREVERELKREKY